MHYGGDYNPEQFDREVWVEDIERMREASVTMVTVGVFSWSRIQPAEGEFDWEWLDEILGMLHEAGIGVDLATATASPPPWLTTAYPDVLPVDAAGMTYSPGSRQHYAVTSPTYRRLAAELVTAMAERYAQHPAVRMWHVNNEYGCHVDRDYSVHAERAFRDWLRRRYGAIEALNAAWGTAFWSQIYTDFAQVTPPRNTPSAVNPGLWLDFRRFSSDAMRDLLIMERDLLRAHGATQPITTNFMGPFPGADYWSWAPEVDLVSDDSYPDVAEHDAFHSAAFSNTLMRSLKPGTPWLLMEQAAVTTSFRPSNVAKRPGQMSAFSAQAIGHGADGVMFFQWRQSERGAEQFFPGMLPHGGTAARSWREIVELGGRLAELEALPAPARAEVALLFDWESWWAMEGTLLPVDIDYPAQIRAWHDALHARHVSVDLAHPLSDLSGHRLVIAPLTFLLSDAGADNLVEYVRTGGRLLITAYSDIVDESCGLRRGGYQVRLRELTGVTTLEFGALVLPTASGDFATPRDVGVQGAELGTLRGQYLAEEIALLTPDVQVHARFIDGVQRGGPALTTNDFGEGEGWYLATLPDAEGVGAVVDWALRRVGVDAPFAGAPAEVEIARRGPVTFVINHSSDAQTVSVQSIGDLDLTPFDWRALRDPAADGVA